MNWKWGTLALVAGTTAYALLRERALGAELLPNWPMCKARNDGNLYDVRDFIRLEEARGIADRLWNGDEKQFVMDSLRWVHSNIAYEADTGEYWRFPFETLSRGAGDCEDMGILLSSIVEDRLPPDRFLTSLGLAGDYGHAWNMYVPLTECYNNGQRVFVDPTQGSAISSGDYELMYLFSSEVEERVG